jgi:hypothetical protein
MKAIISRTRIALGIGAPFALLALLLLSPAAGAPARAQGIATVRPEPASLALQPGDVAEVAIRLENATDVYGIDVRAAFDPAVVEIVDADPDTAGVQMVEGAFPQPDLVALNAADNAAGTLRYVVTQINPTSPANGQGVIFSFQLRARAGGATELAVTLVEMADRDGNLLAVTTGLSTIQVTGPTAAPTGIILQPTSAVTAAPDEATPVASPATNATATGSAPNATNTDTPVAASPTAPPAVATATAAVDTASPIPPPPAGDTPPAPADQPAAGEPAGNLPAITATAAVEAQPATTSGAAGAEMPATAIAGAIASSPVDEPPSVIGEAADGQTGAPADAARSSGPARSGRPTSALLIGLVVALLVAGLALALWRRRG